MDCSPPSSSVHGIIQARILKGVPISFSRGSSQPRDQTQVSCTAADSLPTDLPFKPSIALGPYTILHPLIIPSLSPTYSVLATLASLLSPQTHMWLLDHSSPKMLMSLTPSPPLAIPWSATPHQGCSRSHICIPLPTFSLPQHPAPPSTWSMVSLSWLRRAPISCPSTRSR